MTNRITAVERKLSRTVTLAPPAPGFGGPGHEAVIVLEPSHFSEQDPFILLADDRLDMSPGAAVGGEHPHAGFEIGTLVLEGGIDEGAEGVLRAGDVLWTTAGRGIIHGEHAVPIGPTRILQLWFALPERDRWIEPHFDVIRAEDAPLRIEEGVRVRVYGGGSGEMRVTRREHTPVTLLDIELGAGRSVEQHVPAGYNGFLYVLRGSVSVGGGSELREGQVGWLDRPEGDEDTIVRIAAGDGGARVMLYAGQPQGGPLATHGPFVGGSRADLMRMSREYVDGRFVRMSELARGRGPSTRPPRADQ
jgi:quercetin 2,3-dioxygenase